MQLIEKFVYPFICFITQAIIIADFPIENELHFICDIQCNLICSALVRACKRKKTWGKIQLALIACIKPTHFHHYHSEKFLIYNIQVHFRKINHHGFLQRCFFSLSNNEIFIYYVRISFK